MEKAYADAYHQLSNHVIKICIAKQLWSDRFSRLTEIRNKICSIKKSWSSLKIQARLKSIQESIIFFH